MRVQNAGTVADASDVKVAKDQEEKEDDKEKPKRRLQASFFFLGMGTIAFMTATQVSADYFRHQYEGLEPMRVMSLVYNVVYMLAVFVLFFTPNIWPDKRARMFWGFVVFICSVLGPALVEGLLNEYQSGTAVRYGFIAWGVGSACAGAADAVVATVVNGEASACDCDFHAALGRTTCSLLMVSLRCITKATIHAAPGDMLSMRKSASAHVLITVALLVACVLVVIFALPHLAQQVADAETVAVPPGLNFQQTLDTALTAYESGAQADRAAAALRAAGNLAPMHPGIDSVFGLPMFSIRQSAAARKLSFHMSLGGQHSGVSPSLPTTALGSVPTELFPPFQQHQAHLPQRQSILQRYVASHRHSTLAQREQFSNSNSNSRQFSYLGSRGLNDVFGGSVRKSIVSSIPQAATISTAGSSLFRRVSARRSLQQQGASRASNPQLSKAASVQQQEHTVRGLNSGSSSSSAVDATVQLSDQAPPKPEGSGRLTPAPAGSVLPPVLSGGRLSTARSFKHSSSMGAPNNKQAGLHKLDSLMSLRPMTMTDIKEHPDTVDVPADDLSASPFHSLQLSSLNTLESLDDGAVDVPLQEVLAVCWVIAKQAWVYLCVVFVSPVLTLQIKSIAGARQAYQATLNDYYTQVLFYAQTVGALIGSQLIPVYFPLHQRRRLLVSLTSVLFLFILVFTIVLRYTHNPTAFIPLVFVLFTHSGYINSSAFSLAFDMLESAPDDRRLLQMVMALTTAVSSVVGSCIAFMWAGIKL